MVAMPMCDEHLGTRAAIRSRLHSLGLILRKMFSGKRVFDGPRWRHAAEPEQPRERGAPQRGTCHSPLPLRGAGLPSAERTLHGRCRLRVVDARTGY